MSLLNFALTVHQLFKFNGVGANIIVLRYIFLSRFFEKRTRHDVMIYISYVLEGACRTFAIIKFYTLASTAFASKSVIFCSKFS